MSSATVTEARGYDERICCALFGSERVDLALDRDLGRPKQLKSNVKASQGDRRPSGRWLFSFHILGLYSSHRALGVTVRSNMRWKSSQKSWIAKMPQSHGQHCVIAACCT